MAELRSGQINIPVVGTAVQGPALPTGQNARFTIVADPNNTGAVYVGNDGSSGAGDVTATTGVILDPADSIEVVLDGLDLIWFDTESTGNDISWFFHG